MTDVLPFMLIKPKVTIGGTWGTGVPPADPGVPTGGTELTCFGHKIEFKPDEASNDLEGFCFTARSYKPTRLTVTLSLFQSFGTGNLWDVLVPLAKQVVPMTITPDNTDPTGNPAGTADNPTWYAMVHVPPLPFLNADVGEATDVDLDFDVQGNWYYDPPPGGALMSAQEGTQTTAVAYTAGAGEPAPATATATTTP